MADPLSIASGIIALLTATGNTAQGLNRVWELRSRSQEYLGLCNQVNALSGLLYGTDIALSQIKVDSRSDERFQNCIRRVEVIKKDAASLFAELQQTAQRITVRTSDNSSGKPSKTAWLRRKSKLENMETRVSGLVTSLSAALVILQNLQASDHSRQTSAKIDVVRSKVEILAQQSTQASASPSLDLQIRNVIQELQKIQLSSYQSIDGTLPYSKINAVSRQSSIESFHSAFSSSSDSSGSGTLNPAEKLNDCGDFCPCRCHAVSQLRSPGWTEHLFGSMAIYGNGSIRLKRQTCDIGKCRKSGSTRVQFTYTAPAWSFLQFYKILVTSEMIGRAGPSFNIRLTNIIPNDATIWSLIELGRIAKIRDMLDNGEGSPYDVSPRGVSLLKYAALKGRNDVCACLIAYGADPYYRDQLDNQAIQPGIDRCLSETQLDRNITGTAENSYDLFVNSESLERQGFTVLHLIVLGRHALELEVVLEHFPINIDTPDANGRSPLMWASWRGDLASVTSLLRYGADVNRADNQSWTALARASKAGHLDVVRQLLAAKASQTVPTAQGFQAIHHASDNKLRGQPIVNLLLDHGADPNACSRFDGTPLHNAANRGSVETIKDLLARGAKINAVDSDNDTPAMLALLCWNEAAFFHLADAGARLDIPRKNNINIVHVAIWTASVKTWDLLISYGISGKLQNIDLGVLHKGHDIRTCFDICRNLWFVGVRDLSGESIEFERLLAVFAGPGKMTMGPQPLGRVDSVLH